jgi:uncharacterized SAM-binding protein YcdF (DUF218 family)
MFIIKKIISSFLMPVPLSISISVIGLLLLWFTKRQRVGKIFVSLGVFSLLIFSYTATSNQLLRPLENKYDRSNTQLESRVPSENMGSIKFIVVLGGGHISDSNLPITSQIGEDTLVRLIEGIRLYRKYAGVKLVLSGGTGFDPVPNAHIMANLAKELGVNEKDILIESKSKDTIDEVNFIKPIVNNEKFILVTSALHMPRSMAMFRKLGMNPIPAPTGHKVKDSQTLNPLLFIPNAGDLLKSEAGLHEYLGMVWSKLRGQI